MGKSIKMKCYVWMLGISLLSHLIVFGDPNLPKDKNNKFIGFDSVDIADGVARPLELFNGYQIVSYKSFDVVERQGEEAVRIGDDHVNIVANYLSYSDEEGFLEVVDAFYGSADIVYTNASKKMKKKKLAYTMSDADGKNKKAIHIMSRSSDWNIFYHVLILDEGDRALILNAHGTAYPSTKKPLAGYFSAKTLRSLVLEGEYRFTVDETLD